MAVESGEVGEVPEGVDDGSFPVFQPAVDRVDPRRVAAARAALPWPVAGAPFEFDGMGSIIGVYLAGSYWQAHGEPYLRVGPEPVALPTAVDLGLVSDRGAMLYAFASWHAYPFDDGSSISGSPAWLARILTMVSWTLYARTSDGVPDGPDLRYVCAARANAQCAIVPGGNLHGLVMCAWGIAHALAGGLLAVLEDRNFAARFAGPSKGLPMPAELVAVLHGIIPVPGVDLGVLLIDPDVQWTLDHDQLGVPYVWGRQSMSRAVSTVVAVHRRIIGVGRGAYCMQSYPASRRWINRALANFHLYREISRDLLEASCWVLRMVLDIAYRVYRHFDASTAYLARPSRWVAQLRAITECDPQQLSDGIFRLASESGLPVEWFWEAERRFEAVVREHSQAALVLSWGMRLDVDDSLDRCMVCIPRGEPALPAHRRASAPAAQDAPAR